MQPSEARSSRTYPSTSRAEILTSSDCRFLATQRVAHLATSSPDGIPHVVPIVYARIGDSLYFVVDEKRKPTKRGLKRLRNLTANPHAAVVVDRYSDDWAKLRFLLLSGDAMEVDDPDEYRTVLRLLRRRYHPYRAMALAIETHPMIRLRVHRSHAWSAR